MMFKWFFKDTVYTTKCPDCGSSIDTHEGSLLYSCSNCKDRKRNENILKGILPDEEVNPTIIYGR